MKWSSEQIERIFDDLYDGVYVVDTHCRIIFWNKSAQSLSGYLPVEVLEKCCSTNLLSHVSQDGIELCHHGSCPMVRCMKTGESINEEVYLHHKDGHLVPVIARIYPLYNHAEQIIGAIQIFRDNQQSHDHLRRIQELERLALLDPLTEIGNRRLFHKNLMALLNSLNRYGEAFGVILTDIDHFKKINDTYGHQAGDQILVSVAKTLANALRSTDSVYRWGGEEFFSIVKCVDASQLRAITDKLHQVISQIRIGENSSRKQLTVSSGATIALADDTIDTVIARADKLMYQSKKLGRNRISLFPVAA